MLSSLDSFIILFCVCDVYDVNVYLFYVFFVIFLAAFPYFSRVFHAALNVNYGLFTLLPWRLYTMSVAACSAAVFSPHRFDVGLHVLWTEAFGGMGDLPGLGTA